MNNFLTVARSILKYRNTETFPCQGIGNSWVYIVGDFECKGHLPSFSFPLFLLSISFVLPFVMVRLCSFVFLFTCYFIFYVFVLSFYFMVGLFFIYFNVIYFILSTYYIIYFILFIIILSNLFHIFYYLIYLYLI